MAEHVLWRRSLHESRKLHPTINAADIDDLSAFSPFAFAEMVFAPASRRLHCVLQQ